ncbi:MAG: arsenical pump-driving ATPase [Chthoniobacterales bacterium]
MSLGFESFPALLDDAPRHLFFTGKGGVGKTSMACATAVALADRGLSVLLISTDPASNLDEVLETALSGSATPVQAVPGLSALNIDPSAAAARYRARLIDPLRGALPDAVLRTMEEQLSGACTTEIAAFDEFTAFLADPATTAAFDHVVFDTAPTGHTIRLLQLPKAWTGFLDENTSGTSCLGPLAGLEKQRGAYSAALATLADPAATRLVLVTRPESSALGEAARTSRELGSLGIQNQLLIVNGCFHSTAAADVLGEAVEDRMQQALRGAEQFLESLPVIQIPLRASNVLGPERLRQLVGGVETNIGVAADHDDVVDKLTSIEFLITQLELAGHGVILTMGKGGVGKTTIATKIAVGLAERGHSVTLSTTDPASHLDLSLGDRVPGLIVERIDPDVESEHYQEMVIAEQGTQLDTASLALLEEDLRSPCTEEIAVFRAFARTVAEGSGRFVVLDTAPTGHTLLLLDASEAYHRELGRQAGTSGSSNAVRQLLPRLRDAEFTKVILVTLAEATPVHEALTLQEDLRRAHIEPFAWIVNQSFAAIPTTDPLLTARGNSEFRYLREVLSQQATHTVRIPWTAHPLESPSTTTQTQNT